MEGGREGGREGGINGRQPGRMYSQDLTHCSISVEVHPHNMNWTLSEVLFTVHDRLKLSCSCLQLSKSPGVGLSPGGTAGVGVVGVVGSSC